MKISHAYDIYNGNNQCEGKTAQGKYTIGKVAGTRRIHYPGNAQIPMPGIRKMKGSPTENSGDENRFKLQEISTMRRIRGFSKVRWEKFHVCQTTGTGDERFPVLFLYEESPEITP